MKILLSEAHEWVFPSRSAIYADAKKGVLSTELHHNGRWKIVDLAELERVYGTVTNPNENPNETEMDASEQQKLLIQSMENRIQDLTQQLSLANDRETVLTTEKSRLLDLLDAEKEEKRALLPAPDEKQPNWLFRLVGAR